MAVAYDTYAVGKNASSTTSIPSFNINVGAGVTNGAVAVGLSFTSQAVSAVAVTIGGASAALVATSDSESDGGDYRIMTFGKATGSSTGNLAVVVTWTGASYAGAIAVSASGVDQTTPFQNGNHAVAGSTPIAVIITSETGNLTVSFACDESGSTGFPLNPTQTVIIAEDNVSFQLGQGASRGDGAATVAHSWTTNGGGIISGVDYKVAAGGGASNTPSATPSRTVSFTPSNTPSASATPSFTASTTPSRTVSATPSFTVSRTPSFTPSRTVSNTPSRTVSFTPSNTPSVSSTPSFTVSQTPSFTVSNTPSRTVSFTPSNTPSFTPSRTPSPSGPAYPTLSSQARTVGLDATSAALNLPGEITAGDLILHFCTNDNPGATDMAMSGYTQLFQTAYTGNVIKHAVFGKIASGSDSATLTGAAQDFSVVSVRITNHGCTAIGDVAVGTAAIGIDANPNPPSLDALINMEWMWIACAGSDSDDIGAANPYPTNYTAIDEIQSATGSGSECSTQVAYAYKPAQTEDPGTFTLIASQEWVANTLAVPGIALVTASNTPSFTPSETPSQTPSASATPSFTPSETPSRTVSATPSMTPSASATPSFTPSETPSRTPSFTPSRTVSATPSFTPSRTPSFTPSQTVSATPSFTPSGTPSMTPSVSATPSFTPSVTPSFTPSRTPSFTPSRTPSFTPSFTPSRTPSFTVSRTPSATPSMHVGATALDWVYDTGDQTGFRIYWDTVSGGRANLYDIADPAARTINLSSMGLTTGEYFATIYAMNGTELGTNPSNEVWFSYDTSAGSNTPSLTQSFTPSRTPSRTPSFTPSRTVSATPSFTPSRTPSFTPSRTVSFTPSMTPSASATPSFTPSETPSFTPSATPSFTPSASATPSFTPSETPSFTPSFTLSFTPSFTPSETPSRTPSASATPSFTPSFTASFTPSFTPSRTPSFTPSFTPSRTPSFTPSGTPSASATPSFTPSRTPSRTPSFTPSRTPSFTASRTPSFTPSETPSRTPSETPSFTPSFTPSETPSASSTPSATPSPGTETLYISGATYNSDNSTSAVVAKPSGTVDNDVMFALVSRGDTTDPSSVPAGWTLAAQNAGVYGWWLYYKVALGEGATYTWEWAAGSSTKITITSYRNGFNTDNPIYATSNTAYITSNTTVRAASLVTGGESYTLIYAGSVSYTSAVTFTKPSTQDNDWIEDYDEGTSLSGFSHTFGHCDYSLAGDTGVINITASQTLTTKHAFAVALYPIGYSPSETPSQTPSASATPSFTPSSTPSASATPSFTPSSTPSASATPSRTVSASPSGSAVPKSEVVLIPSKNNRIAVGVCDCIYW